MDMNTECKGHACLSKTACASVITGALVAIGLAVLFNVLSMSLGLSAATHDETGSTILAIGSFIWLFLGTYFTLFLAGWVTGTLAKTCTRNACYGALYGFVMWSLVFILCVFLSASLAGSTFFTLSKVSGFLMQQVDVAPAIKQAHKIGTATLSAFFILLAGAVGSCAGGYFGIKYGK